MSSNSKIFAYIFNVNFRKVFIHPVQFAIHVLLPSTYFAQDMNPFSGKGPRKFTTWHFPEFSLVSFHCATAWYSTHFEGAAGKYCWHLVMSRLRP